MSQNDSINLRLVKNFEHISEATFWPKEIERAQSSLTEPLTFKELDELLNNDFIRTINNMGSAKRIHSNEYKGYLDRLSKLKNTFSYDIDYI